MRTYTLKRNGKKYDYWYERSWKTWMAIELDTDGNQVGEAEYSHDLDGLLAILFKNSELDPSVMKSAVRTAFKIVSKKLEQLDRLYESELAMGHGEFLPIGWESGKFETEAVENTLKEIATRFKVDEISLGRYFTEYFHEAFYQPYSGYKFNF